MRHANRMMSGYLERTKQPGPHHKDAHYNYQLSVLRDLLDRLEVILEDEGVAEETIVRVIRCMLYGSPHPADAIIRAETMEQLTQMLTIRPPRFPG